MRRNRRAIENNGDRIYHNNDDEDENLIDCITKTSDNCRRRNTSLINDEFLCSEDIYRTGEYDKTSSFSNHLLKNASKELHSKEEKNLNIENLTSDESKQVNIKRQKLCHVSVDKLLLTARYSPSKLVKKLALDYYIKHNIAEKVNHSHNTTATENNCACCFEHNNLDRESLLEDLDECYEKLYSNRKNKNCSNIKRKKRHYRRQVSSRNLAQQAIVTGGGESSSDISFDSWNKNNIARLVRDQSKQAQCQRNITNNINNESDLFIDSDINSTTLEINDNIDNNYNNNNKEQEKRNFTGKNFIQAQESWSELDFYANQANRDNSPIIDSITSLSAISLNQTVENNTFERNSCNPANNNRGLYKKQQQRQKQKSPQLEEDEAEEADAEESFCEEEEEEGQEEERENDVEGGNALVESISDSITNNHKNNTANELLEKPHNLLASPSLESLSLIDSSKFGSYDTFQKITTTTALEHCSLTDDSTLSLAPFSLNTTGKEELESASGEGRARGFVENSTPFYYNNSNNNNNSNLEHNNNHNYCGPSNKFIKNCFSNNNNRCRRFSLDENYLKQYKNVFLLTEANSMRARVRDIAKVSVPSLGSLQYLPNQMDSSNKIRKRFGRKSPSSLNKLSQKDEDNNNNKTFKDSSTSKLPSTSTSAKAILADKNNTDVKTIVSGESREEIYHDESLLHRLCLCNCISRNTHANQSNIYTRRSENSSPIGGENKVVKSIRRSKSSRGFSSKDSTTTTTNDEFSSTTLSTTRSSSNHGKSKKNSKVNSLEQTNKREKQSPSFFNLLKSSSPSSVSPPAQSQQEDDGIVEQKKSQQKEIPLSTSAAYQRFRLSTQAENTSKKQARQKKQQQDSSKALNSETNSNSNSAKAKSEAKAKRLGSAGDLEIASISRSSSRNGETSEDNNDYLDSSLRLRSSSVSPEAADLKRQKTVSSDGDNRILVEGKSKNSLNYKRPHSACSNRDDNNDRSYSSFTSGKGYKRYLFPGRLFCSDKSSSKSGNDLTTSASTSDEFQQNNPAEEDDEALKSNKSFFSRSLNRLSNCASPHQAKNRNKTSSTSKTVHMKEEIFFDSEEATDHLSELNQNITYASPTISTASLKDLNSSINSLEDYNHNENSLSFKSQTNKLFGNNKTRLFVGPEIVINKVKNYKNNSRQRTSSDLTEESCDMTRSKSYKYNSKQSAYKTRQQQQDHVSDHNNDDQMPYNEYLSYTSDNWSERAYSLPASPRLNKKHKYKNQTTTTSSLIGSDNRRSPRLSESPVPFKSPATPSTRIEDGLKVCSTEHFEKHIDNIKENQIETQKKLFKAWINHFCPNLIQHDLIDELKDGIKLIGLLAALTRDKKLFKQYERLKKDKQSYINRLVVTPSSRLRHLSNVSISINYLRQNLNMKLINLNPMDIVSGKANVILGLCWSIILNFQLEQNFLKYLEENCSSLNNDNHQNSASDLEQQQTSPSLASSVISTRSTSRLSNNTNEESGNISGSLSATTQSDEYTSSDIILARKKLLDHINKRFNLKLTNLTSNLLDGDVLMTIIKRLIPNTGDNNNLFKQQQLLTNSDGVQWKCMSDNEKLDHCFTLANTHLNVPRLFSASDLNHQLFNNSDNCSKPLLVYLSMLLSSSPIKINDNCSSAICQLEDDDNIENQANSKERSISNSDNHQLDFQNSIPIVSIDENTFNLEDFVERIDSSDKFDIDKMQATINSVRQLKLDLIEYEKKNENYQPNELTLKRFENLTKQVEQLEELIAWINEADNLFERKQKSPNDLIKAIKLYQDFFSIEKVPKIQTFICSTLERQYRECLANSNQRLHFMEQTLKNWNNYEESRKQLKDWLIVAEQKLSTALIEPQSIELNEDLDDIKNELLTKIHTERLEDLIKYFELEPNELESDQFQPHFMLPDDSVSISGSILSLVSNSSRKSALQLSKRAKYTKLFEDFELKCRLLAAMLDLEQREALIFGVKELKTRLKYIIEQRVPQVVGESKLSLERCRQYVQQQQQQQQQTDDAQEEIIEQSEELTSDSPAELDFEKQLHSTTNEKLSKDLKQPSSKLDKKNSKKKQHKKSKSKNKNRKGQDKTLKSFEFIGKASQDDDYDSSIISLIWNKIIRGYKASFSFNIVLLICLAGICVLPLVQKEACCELLEESIPANNQLKPT